MDRNQNYLSLTEKMEKSSNAYRSPKDQPLFKPILLNEPAIKVIDDERKKRRILNVATAYGANFPFLQQAEHRLMA